MSENKNKITEISEMGEFGLIRHLTKDIKLVNSSSILGVGDDAAVLDYKDKQIVVTSDLLTEGVHFDLIYTPMKHLGYKAAVVNFSDVEEDVRIRDRNDIERECGPLKKADDAIVVDTTGL